MALAPHFQGPRPKDRGSVGSAQVCRWPPGGVSGALRPPQSPQDSGETSLTSLWQPHRKVKQRGCKGRVSGPFLGGRCATSHKTLPPSPLCFLSGVFPLTRVADSVCTWWDHAFEGSRSPWPTTRAPTPELEEGCLRDIPVMPSQPPNFHSSGTNPRTGHWTACLCPVKDVADVTVEPPTGEPRKGKRGVQFLPTCGAAQEKQSAAQFDASRPPRFFCLGCFRPLATTGAIPRTGFQAPRCTVRCTVRYSVFRRAHCGSLQAGAGRCSRP